MRGAFAIWLLLAALFGAVGSMSAPPSGLAQDATNRAGLVVRLDADTVLTRCVSFAEQRISGVVLLERSGLEVETIFDSGLGAFVCQIDRVGCPAENCLCAFPPDFWVYAQRVNAEWQSSPVGASTRTLTDGDMDGWVWGSSGALPDLDFTDVCPTDEPERSSVYLPLVVNN